MAKSTKCHFWPLLDTPGVSPQVWSSTGLQKNRREALRRPKAVPAALQDIVDPERTITSSRSLARRKAWSTHSVDLLILLIYLNTSFHLRWNEAAGEEKRLNNIYISYFVRCTRFARVSVPAGLARFFRHPNPALPPTSLLRNARLPQIPHFCISMRSHISSFP